MSEQPEVPTSPAEVVSVSNINLEEEILRGSEEDQLIGQDAPTQLPDAAMLQHLQTQAMLEVANAVKILIEDQKKTRQLGINEIKPDTPWNPEGKRDRAKLTRVTMQHGRMLNPILMTEEEIILLNKLKPGRYLNRKVEVQRSTDGSINLTWPNAKIEQRMEFAALYPTLAAVCRAIVADREDKEAKKKSGWFDPDSEL